jgi:hypothetical protein
VSALSNTITFEGDISAFEIFTDQTRFNGALEREVRRAMIKASLYLIKEVKQRIKDKKYIKNTPLTLVLAGGRKDTPLLKIKNMVDAISYMLKDSFEAEVGFVKDSKTTGGVKSPPYDMKRVVTRLHEGCTITVTPRMRKAIIMALTGTKTKKGNVKRSAQEALTIFKYVKGSGVWRVPARPFLSDVFQDKEIQKNLQSIWREALEKTWLAQKVKDGEHRDRG